MLGALFHKLFERCCSKGKFGAIQVDLNKYKFPDPKLDTFVVPREPKIELWLQREAHYLFSAHRLEMAQIYPSEDPQRLLKVLGP